MNVVNVAKIERRDIKVRVLTPLQALSAISALTLLAGCSGNGSSIAPKPTLVSLHVGGQNVSYYSCPATGPIEYVSDAGNSVIDIYAGKLAGQAPCGQIVSGLNQPQELYVEVDVHDLYVANLGGNDILVYHRGQTTPYNTYTDPTAQLPEDVTVAADGTVVASNQASANNAENGSLSTWIGGPGGGTFVGNFPMTHRALDGISVIARKNGVIYFSDYLENSHSGALWTVSCPAGACGTQTRIFVNFSVPGGMEFDDTGDLLAVDETRSRFCTFELPNAKPVTFPLGGGDPRGLAIGASSRHVFITELINNDAAEYSYPDGSLVGTVSGSPGATLQGIAYDP
jgi:hypothetical protein